MARIVADDIEAKGYQAFVATSVGDATRLIARESYSAIVADYFGPREAFPYRWPILQLLARFAPGFYEIGGWWAEESCTVVDEHGARVMTERLMSDVSSKVEKRAPVGRRIMVACAENERHELGARMVAGLFAWQTVASLRKQVGAGIAKVCRVC